MATDSITRRLAAACGLLGQYARTAAAPPPASCFVQQQPPSGAAVQDGSANAKQQLTILYGGTVVVLDGCAPEKAAELISLAAAAAGQGAPQLQPALVDSQIARSLSLRRFLSKRKERVPHLRKDDDEEEEPAAKKGKLAVSREEAASWLSLGSMATMHAP
ncbi:hypothetical protein EJB05_07805, partial [Eragrostis curvula]